MIAPYPTRGIVAAATKAELYTDPDVFPHLPGRDFVASKGPSWSTGVKRAASGREVRSAAWSTPIWEFKLKHPVLRDLADKPEVGKLLSFFNSRMGRFGFFYYLDEDDNSAPLATFATGDGVTTQFQLSRRLGADTPYVSVEPVYALWGTPTVAVNGTPTGAFTVDPWGQLKFTTAPADGAAIAWAGQFLYVCRFDQDKLTVEQIVKALWSQDGMTFCSLKP